MGEMWTKIKTFISEHPYAAGAIIFVIGAILVYFIFRRSSSGGNVVDNSGYYNALASTAASGNALQAAQEGYQAQIALANIGAGVQTTASNNQLTAVENQTGAQVTLGTAAINEQGHEADLSSALGTLQSNLSAQIAGAQISSANYIANLGATLQNNLISSQNDLTTKFIAQSNYQTATQFNTIGEFVGLLSGNTGVTINAALSQFLENPNLSPAATNIVAQNMGILTGLNPSLVPGANIPSNPVFNPIPQGPIIMGNNNPPLGNNTLIQNNPVQ